MWNSRSISPRTSCPPRPFVAWHVLRSGLCNTSHVLLHQTVSTINVKKCFHCNMGHVSTYDVAPFLCNMARVVTEKWTMLQSEAEISHTSRASHFSPSFVMWAMLQSQAELTRTSTPRSAPVLCNMVCVAIATWAMLQIPTGP